MPVVINPASELGKELRKWEQHHTRFALDENGDMKPGNPYVFRPYPKMLYRAQRRAGGQPACMLGEPQPFDYDKPEAFERACLEVASFNQRCTTLVDSEDKERLAFGQGWRATIPAALELFEEQQKEVARAAAEAAFAAKRMSEQAQGEFAAADASTHEHVTDVVGSSKKTRGRKPKARATQIETE